MGLDSSSETVLLEHKPLVRRIHEPGIKLS
jgi:hypothetical protein